MTDDTAHGGWIALDPQTGYVHVCAAGRARSGRSISQAYRCILDLIGGLSGDLCGGTAWADFSDGEPFTYPSKCWECEKEVYAHSNGFGDFVLFDAPLGPPWPRHLCYLLRRTNGRKLADVLSEGLLLPWGDTPTPDFPELCGIIWSRQPSPGDRRLDIVEILVGKAKRPVNIDYWRIGPRPGAPVWLFNDAAGTSCVIPVGSERIVEVDHVLAQIVKGEQQVILAGPPVGGVVVTGLIVGMESAPGYVVKNFSKPEFELRMYGEKPRLLWILTDRNELIPVILKKWYGNQAIGTRWTAEGAWEQVGSLLMMVAQNLLG